MDIKRSSKKGLAPAERNFSTRRTFIIKGVKAGTFLFVLPSAISEANAGCSAVYGSGLYGQGCYAGTLPRLLELPPTQANIQQDGFRFFLKGEPNRSYRIEHSSNFIDWIVLGILTMPSNGTALEILDSETTLADRRFYRANPL